MKKTSVYIITAAAALSLLLCACGARPGNVVTDAKDDVVDTTDQVVDDVKDTTRDVADDMMETGGSDGIVRDDDGIIDDDDTGRMNQNANGTVNDIGGGMSDDVPGMTEEDGDINAGGNSLDTSTDNSIGAATTTDVPTAR